MAHGLNPPDAHVCKWSFTGTRTRSCTVSGCCPATMGESSSCTRDHIAQSLKYILTLFRKSLPTPALVGNKLQKHKTGLSKDGAICQIHEMREPNAPLRFPGWHGVPAHRDRAVPVLRWTVSPGGGAKRTASSKHPGLLRVSQTADSPGLVGSFFTPGRGGSFVNGVNHPAPASEIPILLDSAAKIQL